MAEVRASQRDGLAVLQATHILPHHLFVTERGPAVHLRLLEELVEGAPARRNEERLSGDAVVVRRFLGLVHLVKPCCRAEVARILCEVPIVVADLVRKLRIAPKTQTLHDRPVTCPVLLLLHDGLVALEREALLVLLHVAAKVEKVRRKVHRSGSRNIATDQRSNARHCRPADDTSAMRCRAARLVRKQVRPEGQNAWAGCSGDTAPGPGACLF